MPLLDRPEGRIAYDLYGDGNTGPLVVCVPGMLDHRLSYRFLGPALAEAGFRVAAMDLRGHGDSDATFDAYDDAAAGSDVLALAEELGGEPAVLVGNSMGAAASVWAAAKRPDLVDALVLLGPFLRDAPMSAPARAAMRAALLRPWGPKVLTTLFRQLHAGRKPDGLTAHTALIRANLGPRARYRAVVRTARTSHAQVLDLAPTVTAPVMVVMGSLDPDWPDPREEAEQVMALLAGARSRVLLVVDDCGHYPQTQRPDVLVPRVVTFARHTAGAGDA